MSKLYYVIGGQPVAPFMARLIYAHTSTWQSVVGLAQECSIPVSMVAASVVDPRVWAN